MRAVLVLAALVAGAAAVWYASRRPAPVPMDLPALAARDLGAVGSRSLPLELESTSPDAIGAYLNADHTRPRVRVLPIERRATALEGAVHHRLDTHAGALYSYRADTGQRIVVQVYPGALDDWPMPDEAREHRDRRFRVYRRSGATVVCWREDPLVYVLASDLPDAEVIQMAFAAAAAR